MPIIAEPSSRNETGLQDRFGRRVTYLRVSVTDRCNLRCKGCFFFSSDEDKAAPEEMDVNQWEGFIEKEMARGVNLANLQGWDIVVGEDARRIDAIWHRLHAALHQNHAFAGPAMSAVSALDTALWDIAGKAANQPIYNLLGGQYHEKLRAYAYMPSEGLNEHPEKAGEVAALVREEGGDRIGAFRRAFSAVGEPVSEEIAAKVAKPEAPVICFAGDGGILMTGNELATAVQHGIDPVGQGLGSHMHFS